VGIIPGPKEPKMNINSFLSPLVQELQEFWHGVMIKYENHPLKQICVRAALTCCACDIPAARKLCGFVGHSATMGCSKCAKQFHYDHDAHKLDFSGYDRDNWPIQTLSAHREVCNKYLLTQTKIQRKSIEREHGVRYSVLVDLPYFNPIRYTVVDPMHNLFLGTAKHVMQTWINKDVLSKADLEKIEQTVSKIHMPRDVGRLPLKITSGFAGFTADQWRNWVTIFSPIALKCILDNAHLHCWLLFVRACNLLCTRIITTSDIHQADQYLVEFCKQFVLLYGNDSCTPNLHLHLHLKDCLLDYDPVHTFWLFSFERYNGLLGKFYTNNQMIEEQIMRKFLSEQHIAKLNIPSEAADMFQLPNHESGSLCEMYSNEDVLQLKVLSQYDSLHSDYSLHTSDLIKLLPPHYNKVLSTTEDRQLKCIYKYIYPTTTIKYFSQFYTSGKKCLMANELFSSSDANECSSVVMAYWPVKTCSGTLERELQVGMIKRFMKHKVKVMENGCTQEKVHVFAHIHWYVKHNQANWYGTSAKLCTNITYTSAACSFMPVQRVLHRCAYGKLDVVIPPNTMSEKVLVAIPIHMKFTL